jgi:hypothetical protein
MFILPLVVLTIWLMPKPLWTFRNTNTSNYSLLRRLDIPGVLLITAGLLLFILGLTQGTVLGWKDSEFIAPFTLSIAMFLGFFAWEYSACRLPYFPLTHTCA